MGVSMGMVSLLGLAPARGLDIVRDMLGSKLP